MVDLMEEITKLEPKLYGLDGFNLMMFVLIP